MRKKAIIVLANGFEELEAVTVIDILRRAGIEVTVCGLDSEKIKGSHEITIIADKKLEQAEAASRYDACILPGGMPGAEKLASSDKVKELLVKMHAQNKIIAAICASPALVLSSIGILDNKSATCYPSVQTLFASSTTYKEDSVVIDGNIITSRGPATALEFAISIIEVLRGRDIAEKISKDLLAE